MSISSNESSTLLLSKLGALLSQPPQHLSIPLLPQSLCSPSPLLTSLIRAACYIDLATSRREIATQTDQTPIPTSSNKRRSHHEDKEEVRRHKKRKRKKESKPRKKKKEKRKSYCASPSYSDYEPENPILRRNLRWVLQLFHTSFD